MEKIFVGMVGNRSLSDNGFYVAFVERALSDFNIFQSFKAYQEYHAILENVSLENGLKYLKIIASQTPHFIDIMDKFKINDAIGNPYIVAYGPLEISPSTLKYVKVASDISILFGDNFKTIAEIGVGYGGQLLVMDQVVSIERCDLFDLPPVLELTSKYLEAHTLQSSYRKFTLNQHDGQVDYDLVISNYAFSELPSRLQRMYCTKVLSKSARGYLTMNSGMPNSVFQDDKLSLQELADLLPKFEILEEDPLGHVGNYIIVWGHRHNGQKV